MFKIHIHVGKEVPTPEKRPSRLNVLTLWLIAAAGLLLSSLLSLWIDPALSSLNPHLRLLLYDLLYYLPFIALPVFLLAKRTQGLCSAYRPNPISLFDTICIAILALLGMFFVNDLSILWCIPLQKLGFDVFSSSIPSAANTTELALCILYTAVLPGVCEEFLFRGAIFPAFEAEGSKRGMLLSAVLFMLLHGSVTGAPIQFILGVILAVLVFWTDSIYAGLIYHTVHNAASVLLQYIQDHAAVGAEAATETTDLLTAIGGTSGLATLIVELLISGGLILISLRMFKIRGLFHGVTLRTGKKEPLRRREWAVLLGGLALCLAFYITDILGMLGG